MQDREELLNTILSLMETPFERLNQAATAGAYLGLLSTNVREDDRLSFDELVARYRRALADADMEGVIENQTSYAIDLGITDRDLIFEEMHKIFSLCDEIEGLRRLGMTLTEERERELERALRSRFANQRRLAKSIAKDRVKEWSSNLWWYRVTLEDE